MSNVMLIPTKRQKDLLKKANQKDDYDAIADEIFRLRDMLKQSKVDCVVRDHD